MGAAKNAASQRAAPAERPAEQRPDVRDMLVTELMASPAVTVELAASLPYALRRLAVFEIRHLVVVDESGTAVGMLTDRSIAARWVSHPATFDRTIIAALVVGDQPFVEATSTLAGAARVMRRLGADAVGVLDGDRRPVGVVTTADLIALMAKSQVE